MKKQYADINLMYNRAMQILSNKTTNDVYNEYMNKLSDFESVTDEKSIKEAINTINNFKYFLSSRYFIEKKTPKTQQILYNVKLDAIRHKLIESLFDERVEMQANKQKIK